MTEEERAAIRGQVAAHLSVIEGGKGPEGASFRMTFADDLTDEDDIKSWRVDDLFGVGETTCVYGLPGGGKSVWLGDGACHVATNTPWFGRAVSQCAVMYIAAERATLVRRRARAWRRRHEVHTLPLVIMDGVFDLVHGTGHAEALIRRAAEIEDRTGLPVGWIIVDTKSQVMAGANPNDDAETMALVKSGRVLQEALNGAHVTYVDHVPHTAPDRMKGSGALAGAVDGSFLVSKEGKEHFVTIGSKPPNDGPDELDLSFRCEGVRLGQDPKGKWTFAPVVVPSESACSQPAAKGAALKFQGQIVLSAFGRLFDGGATHPPPRVPGVMSGTLAVTDADLRKKAIDMGLFPEPRPDPSDAKAVETWKAGARKAWQRGTEQVVGGGHLRFEEGFWWELRSRGTSRSTGD